MNSSRLVGTWSLSSFVAKGSDGSQAFAPFGDAPKGFITYTADGYMSAVLMRAGRPKFASGDMRAGTAEEIKHAFEGFEAYAGRYEFDSGTDTVTHHMSVARFPNWEGAAHVRGVKLHGTTLELTSEISAMGQVLKVSVTWERA